MQMTHPGTYPEVTRDVSHWQERPQRHVGLDFEFHPDMPAPPTVIGLSRGSCPLSVPYGRKAMELMDKLDREEVQWVAHNGLTVERKIMQAELGREIPVERVTDTMVRHYLLNAHLCKGVGKDEEDEGKGQGFMDLWSMASLYTDLPQWKQCRGARCEGPCPIHDPLGYNGIDTLACDVAFERQAQDMREKKIPAALESHVNRLMVLCDQMSERGVSVDRAEVERLEKEMQTRKDAIFPWRMETVLGKKGQPLKNQVKVWDSPFNPASPKAIVEWFGAKGVQLESADRDSIHQALDHMPEGKNEETRKWLENLYDYKTEGKGLSPWFDSRFFGRDGLMHPRFNPTGTSLGRLSSSGPNFQNIPRVGFGKNVRRVIVPRDSSLVLVKADKSQLELRMILWKAGVYDKLPKHQDAFAWLVQQSNGAFAEAESIAKKGWTERDWAKSVSHGFDYGEGCRVFYPSELSSAYTKRLIDAGALVVYRDWHYNGGVMCFTGANLAQRLFGDATWPNRKKALLIQEAFGRAFPEIRQWQKRVSHEAEKGYIQTESGRRVELYGTPEDKFKIALAMHGQGSGADDVQEGMLRYAAMGEVPVLQVHDEVVFEKDRVWAEKDSNILEFFSVFSAESKFFPGFEGPVKASVGENWLDMRTVGAC